MNPRRLAIVAAAALAAAAVLVAIVRYGRQVEFDLTHGGPPRTITFIRNPVQVAPVDLMDLEGRQFRLTDLRGKVVLVNFWATWCPPCRQEIPDLIALQEKYRDRLQVIGISEDESSPQLVKAYATANGINYPIVMETGEIRRAFPAVHALPTTFLLDREGRLVKKQVGLLNAALTEVETRALAGLPVNAKIEETEDDPGVRLANAAQANKIPGLDLSKLSPDRKAMALQQLNKSPCTCGCGLTLAQCRVDDPTCEVSLPLARLLVDQIAR